MLNKNQQKQLNLVLFKLGLSEKEIVVYLNALENRESSVITLSKNSGLTRGTVYDIVEKLKTKGFLAETKKGKKRRIIIENPTGQFYSLLERQHNDLQQTEKMVEEILPLIKSINVSDDSRPQIRVYAGETGFKKVWDEILSTKMKEFLSITRIETFVKFVGEEFLQEVQERKLAAGISSRAINEDSPLARRMLANDEKYNRETRLTPQEFNFPSGEIIYGDNIAMFSTRQENIIIVIDSKDFAETHRMYFEMVWRFLKQKEKDDELPSMR